MLRKILIKVTLALLFILGLIDRFGSFIRKSFLNVGRIGVYILFGFFLLTGFVVERKNQGFLGIVDLFQPTSAVLGSASNGFRVPELQRTFTFPYVSAKSVFALDLNTGKVLADINSLQKLPPASTTKLMTALVALDNYGLGEDLIMSPECAEVEALKAGFYAYESFNVEDLLYSLLVFSSSDAACLLSTAGVEYTDFIDQMNSKAQELGLYNSSFNNPIGLDGTNGDHVSTARDLAKLAQVSIEVPLIKDIVKTKIFEIEGSEKFKANLWNTNELLWTIEGSVGIKTGRTAGAGEVLIYQYQDGGKDILIVVMGSDDRFGDTTNILNWIIESYRF